MLDNIKLPKKSSKSRTNTSGTVMSNQADPEPDFVPPEMVDNADSDTSAQSSTVVSSSSKKTSGFKNWMHRIHWPRNRKEWIILGTIVLVVVGLCAAVYLIFFHKKPIPKPTPVVTKKVVPPKPTAVASTLTGVPVSPETNQLPITGVMIENSPDARPQAGLTNAGVVFEAVAEGGITRFLALFQSAEAIYIGPVRSARPYYLDWLQGFDASIAHVGGSPDALAAIKSQGIKDLDQFTNSGSYQRVNNRYAPHNVYTSADQLVALERAKGYNTSNFSGFARKVSKPVKPATATSIDMSISGYLYNTHYDYDAASNTYKRSEGDKPHVDEKSGVQIAPSVVIAMVMPQGLMSDGVHTTYGDVGSGKAYVFQDGGFQEGTWSKSSAKAQITFADSSGAPLKLIPGQTWITAIGQASSVTHKP